jgi:hypothetical protein
MKVLNSFLFLFCTVPVNSATAKCTADSAKAHVDRGYRVLSAINFGEKL